MKAYKNVMIEILELNEDVITGSGDSTGGVNKDYNDYDDTIGAFGL